MLVKMEKYPAYLPAENALVPKTCRFCHALMEIKQINLTVAVRQCYQCTTPLQHLDFTDIEFYHRSYRDRNKSPSGWSTLENSEEEELNHLKSWIEKLNISLAKYEESSDDDDDMTAGNSNNSGQYPCNQPLSRVDDLNFDDVGKLQNSVNSIDQKVHNGWVSEELDELDALLESVSSRKSENVTELPFSPHDLLFSPAQASHSAADSKRSNDNFSMDDSSWYSEVFDGLSEPVSVVGHITAKDKSVLTKDPLISESVESFSAGEPSTPETKQPVLCDDCVTSEKTEFVPAQGLLTSGTMDSASVEGLHTSEIMESFSVGGHVTSEDAESVSTDGPITSVMETSHSTSECVDVFHKPPFSRDCEVSSELQFGAKLVTGKEKESESEILDSSSSFENTHKIQQSKCHKSTPLIREVEKELAAAVFEFEMLDTEVNTRTSRISSENEGTSPISCDFEDVNAISGITVEKQNEGNGNMSIVNSFQNHGTLITYSLGKVVSPHRQMTKEMPSLLAVCTSETCRDQEDNYSRFAPSIAPLNSPRPLEPCIPPSPSLSIETTESSLNIHPLSKSVPEYNQSLVIEAVVSDWEDEHLQLPYLSENYCIDVKMPDLSLSCLKGETIVEDLEEAIYTFPSDLDKVMFSQFIHHPSLDNTSNQKEGCQTIDTESEEVCQTIDTESEEECQIIDTESEEVCQTIDTESEEVCQTIDTESEEVCQTIDTESEEECHIIDTESEEVCQTIDIESEEVCQTIDTESKNLLEECVSRGTSPSMISLPPIFDLSAGSILFTVPADINITSEMLGSASLADVPVFLEGPDGIFVQAPAGKEQRDCGSSAVHLNITSSETPALSFQLQQNGDVHVQPYEAGIHEDSEYITAESNNSTTYSCTDQLETNCLYQLPPTSVSTKASVDEDYFADELNKISSVCVDQPLRLVGVTAEEDDEELKCFTGAKFKPIPNRKQPLKEGGVETRPRYLNLLQAMQRDIATATSGKK